MTDNHHRAHSSSGGLIPVEFSQPSFKRSGHLNNLEFM